MRILVSTIALTAVMSYTVAPFLLDLHRHCLGHDRGLTVTMPRQEQSDHGVHHQDCHWLQGTRDQQAILAQVAVTTAARWNSPWLAAPVVPLTGRSYPIFAGRAPPPILL